MLDIFTGMRLKLHINFGTIDIFLCLLFIARQFPVNSFVFSAYTVIYPKVTFLTDYLNIYSSCFCYLVLSKISKMTFSVIEVNVVLDFQVNISNVSLHNFG